MSDTDPEAPEPKTTSGKNRRKPSTGFPVVSLAEAAKILKDAGRYGFDHSIEEFASYMGHTTTNSGAFRQRLSAFRDWKLIAGRGDTVSMTQIGRYIALPPDDESEHAALQDAFRSCVVFAKVYDEARKNTALERQVLGRRAALGFGVSPNSVNKFVESFVESAVVAGLAEKAGDDQVILLDDALSSDALPTTAASSAKAEPAPATSAGQRAAPARVGTPVVHQTWPIADGLIVFEIRSEQPIPASAYVMVGEVVSTLERLATTLAPLTGAVDDADDED